MARINISTQPLTCSALQVEKVEELCKMFPTFKGIGVNDLGVTFVEWRETPKNMIGIKEEILNILELPLTKDVRIYNILNESTEASDNDILSLKDNTSICQACGSKVSPVYKYAYAENEIIDWM